MPFSRQDRKVALIRLNLTIAKVATDLGVNASLVSHVIAGRKLSGTDARRIIQYVSDLVGAPAEEVFPGSERRADKRSSMKPSIPTSSRGKASAVVRQE